MIAWMSSFGLSFIVFHSLLVIAAILRERVFLRDAGDAALQSAQSRHEFVEVFETGGVTTPARRFLRRQTPGKDTRLRNGAGDDAAEQKYSVVADLEMAHEYGAARDHTALS